MKKYKTIDLFAGIGGIRRGFELTGRFENLISAEIDPSACMTYEHLYGENPMNDVTSSEFKNKVSRQKYDVLLAGFPCQTFSIAGKKEGFLDKTRGTLFFDIADILSKTQPKAFLLENVEGLTSHKKGQTFRTVLETLTLGLGYKVIGVEEDDGTISYDRASFIRSASDFGIPQKRPRTYIMGFKKELVEHMIFEELPVKRSQKPIYKDLNELLDSNVKPNFYMASGYLNTLKEHRKRHGAKGNGFGYMVVNDPNESGSYTANTILATGGSGKERNLVYQPRSDIAGMILPGKKTHLNDEGIRHMTPNEWGKLQGFVNYAFIDPKTGKDRFSFPKHISNAQRYKQFGNSVCIPVIEELARYMVRYLDLING